MARIQRERIAVGGSPVSVYRIAPPGPRRGTILVPPLIGGGGLQQYGYYKAINRRGFELVSFDYRGHGRSGGRFSIHGSLQDTLAVAAAVRDARGERELLGMGNCYGAIPLLHAARRDPGLFRAVLLFNPIPDLQDIATPREVLRNYFRPAGRLAWRNPFDLRGIAGATIDRLFPAVDRSREHFGILRFARAREVVTALEFLLHHPLRRVRLPDLPALVVYGRADSTLRLGSPAAEAAYRRSLARILPRAQVRAFPDVDHYWTACYERANEEAFGFFTSDSVVAARREPSPPRRAPRPGLAVE
ncbi:MAG: alpha/beta fold hydrolase [Planctomycetota bacterium]